MTRTRLWLVMAVCVWMQVAAVDVMFRNECGKTMVLSDGKTNERIKANGNSKHTLKAGDMRAYRYSDSNQATLAEFTVDATNTWFDIGIIPTSYAHGPGNCSSLEDCKKVTGGVGFNVAMKIIPGFKDDEFYGEHCRTLTCLADGCPDAYQFPADNAKTHNCPADIHFTVVFCATESTGSSDSALGWEGSQPDADAGQVENDALRTPVPSPTSVTTKSGKDGDDSTSVAVIIASMMGGFIVVIAGAFLFRKFRYLRYERMNSRKYGSDSIVFVEARDSL